MKKVLLSTVLGATLAGTSAYAMEEICVATPTVKATYNVNAATRAQYAEEWEKGLIKDVFGTVNLKVDYRDPLLESQYTNAFDINDPKPVLISSLLLTALLEREGEDYGDKKFVAFSHGGKSFNLRLRKRGLEESHDIIECTHSNVCISGAPEFEHVPGWVVSLASLQKPYEQLIFSIIPIENPETQK